MTVLTQTVRLHKLFTALLLTPAALLLAPSLNAQFTPPTAAELAMTSIPQVPNAPAVYLFREETTEDKLHMHSFYVRLKVLTEGGKEYANVELPFVSGGGNMIDSIAARTIQPDGSVVLFTGKPYDKLIEKSQGSEVKAKVFTLPAVQVGSILEYRYKIRYDDQYVQSPDWYIQSELYTMAAHYNWKPTSSIVTTSDERGDTVSSIAWTPLLPPGVTVKQTAIIGAAQRQYGQNEGGGTQLDLVVHDIPPLPREADMPPVNSLSYRVLFYYTSYKTTMEYWTREGKRWAKDRDKFIGPGSVVKGTVKDLVAAGDTDEQKLKKIYDAVTLLENTNYSRSREVQEEKAAGLKPVANTDDILTRKRGTDDQLTQLFVAMVRAAGMKAYLMAVSNRSQRLFLPSYLSMYQLNDYIAIVPVNGKDVFFDPGERYCTFEHLAWQHTLTGGLRETETGTALISTPSEPLTTSITKRVGDLTLDDQGVATGSVTLTYTGAPALRWRQQALRGDDTSLNGELRRHLEGELPGGMDVRVTDVANLADADKPLIVKYEVKGAVGSATGKRLLLPASLFEVNARPRFTEAKREVAVDMQYPEIVQDAVRYSYPASLTIESSPTADLGKMTNVAAYSFSAKSSANAVTLYRNLSIGKTYFTPEEYPELRTFYGKLDARQGESVVLTRADAAPAKPAGGN